MGESDDITIDTIIDEIVKEVPNRKVKGRLNNHRVYLAGPIDHADDDGKGWREDAEKWRGVEAEIDPLLEEDGANYT